MTRQPVHVAQVTVFVHGFGVDVVCGDVIGARHDQATELAFLSRHAMQRLDVRRYGDERYQRRLGVIQELAPGTFHRHGFHVPPVTR